MKEYGEIFPYSSLSNKTVVACAYGTGITHLGGSIFPVGPVETDKEVFQCGRQTWAKMGKCRFNDNWLDEDEKYRGWLQKMIENEARCRLCKKKTWNWEQWAAKPWTYIWKAQALCWKSGNFWLLLKVIFLEVLSLKVIQFVDPNCAHTLHYPVSWAWLGQRPQHHSPGSPAAFSIPRVGDC